MKSIASPRWALEAAEQLHDRRLDTGRPAPRSPRRRSARWGSQTRARANRHPLPLPPGQLVRVAAGVRRGQRYPLRASPRSAGRASRPLPVPKTLSGLPDDLADRLPGVQRAVRILEDVLDPPPRFAAALARGAAEVRRRSVRCCRSSCGAGPRSPGRPLSCPEPDSPTSARHSWAARPQAHRVEDLVPPVTRRPHSPGATRAARPHPPSACPIGVADPALLPERTSSARMQRTAWPYRSRAAAALPLRTGRCAGCSAARKLQPGRAGGQWTPRARGMATSDAPPVRRGIAPTGAGVGMARGPEELLRTADLDQRAPAYITATLPGRVATTARSWVTYRAATWWQASRELAGPSTARAPASVTQAGGRLVEAR